MAATAVQKLRPSRLSDQLETLNTDIDLASLNLAVNDKASFPLLERLVDSNIQRTVEGSSQLTLVADDADRVLLRSGYIGKGLDTEIDGLWFRLWSWSGPQDDKLTLTFIDREVAVLKEWPPRDKPQTWLRTWPADKFGLATRFHFAKQLIDDVSSILPIRFVCPKLSDQSLVGPPDPAPNPGHGFPAQNNVTVKHQKASAHQLAVLDAVLKVCDENKARRKVMIATVITVTQESDAGDDVGNDPHAVGVFQQNPDDGWPATGDPSADAEAFVRAAISEDQKFPNTPPDEMAQDVQLSGHPKAYAQWVDEATNTVDVWLGNGDTTTPAGALINTEAPDPTKGQFLRGRLETPTAAMRKHKAYIVQTQTQGNKVVVREDNWACLTRLAQEIGYRCYCVSGTVYFIDDYTLFHQRVAMTLSEDADGVDTISADFTQGKPNAKRTVVCRADRWKAPPGGVAAVEDMGPQASGRWLVASTSRSLSDPTTTITLQKPVSAIPESAAPEHGAGQTSGVQIYHPPPAQTTTDTETKSRVLIAAQLLDQLGTGWIDDNGKGADQIRKVAQGLKLHGAQGAVDLDTRTMRVILWLIGRGYTIGTYAWCEDHSNDGPNGHAGGKAVDISSIDGLPINVDSTDVRAKTLAVATALHNLGNAEKPNSTEIALAPRQLICGGYGGKRDATISALSIPGADSYYGAETMQEHTNHIHVGY